MRDKGLDLGMIRYFDDSHRNYRGQGKNFFGFRKMFRDYLEKLNVAFYDSCCPALTGDIYPVRFNAANGSLERFNGTTWVNAQGGVSLTAQNNIAAGAGGAIPVNNYFTTINTDAGGDAFTLADGTAIGQRKRIRLVVDGGGDGVVTPANLNSGTTITFNDAGDDVELVWGGSEWYVVANIGATVA